MASMLKICDVVTLKKAHPCGGRDFKVIRVGADIKLECIGCGHLIMIDYSELKKRIIKLNGGVYEKN